MRQGEVVGLLGPNGAGKTTSFYSIVGLIPPDTGRVLYDDEDITSVPMYLRARQYGISYLPQEASVFRKLTVEENILAVLEAQPISWHERREKAEKLIDQLGLEHIRQNQGYALSGGERRRVEIARSLCINPTFILLDEPFSGIDPIAVLDLQKIISDLRASGIGILITDHNVRETLSVTDRAYIITEGRISLFRHAGAIGQQPGSAAGVSGRKLLVWCEASYRGVSQIELSCRVHLTLVHEKLEKRSSEVRVAELQK